MKSSTKIVLGVLGGVAAGGAAGYYFWRSSAGQALIEEADELVPVRIPDPSFAMDLASMPEHFNLVDDHVCSCGIPVMESFREGDDGEEAVKKIQDCIVRKIYPDFPWPHMSGDHPSVAVFYSDIGFAVRQALARNSICKDTPPS